VIRSSGIAAIAVVALASACPDGDSADGSARDGAAAIDAARTDATDHDTGTLDAGALDATGFVRHLEISVVETRASGAAAGDAYASAMDVSDFEIPRQVIATVGDCSYTEPIMSSSCEPQCTAPAFCRIDGSCRPPYQQVSWGTIDVSGLRVGLQLTPTTQYYYYVATFDPEPTGGALFDRGAAITATAPGDTVPGFSVATVGVEDLVATLPCPISLTAGQPLTISWTAAAQPETMHFVLQSGNHAEQFARIECECADTGALTVDGALITQYLSMMRPLDRMLLQRLHRGAVQSAGTAVTFDAISQVSCM
jgi:hypothetical protein